MATDSPVNPFVNEPAFNMRPSLPDIDSREPLGSGVVTRLLGHGGMANVYEIWISSLEVYRAVKIIKPDCNKDSLERFQTEIKILAKLTHPNIIHIHSVGEWKGLPYIEMDKIDGWTLFDILQEKGALPLDVVVSVSVLVLRGLHFAHNHKFQIYGKEYNGVIHRDLKPNNVMLCRNGDLMLMDFGVARPADASFHTVDGAVVGTIQYMSPEMMAGKKFDFKTDIYAFGATVYELLTAINPFNEANFSRLITLKQKNKFKDLGAFRIKIPLRLKSIIHKCMQTDPEKRFRSTTELLRIFEKLQKKLCNEKPETILDKYVKTLVPGNKYVPDTRFHISLKSVLFASLTISLVGLATFGGVHYLRLLAEDRKAQDAANAASEIARISATEKRNDSIASIIESLSVRDEEPITKPEVFLTQKQNPLPKKEVKVSVKASVKEIPSDEVKNSQEAVVENTKKVPEKKNSDDEDVEALAMRHGTKDLHELLNREYAAGNHSSALAIYDEIAFRDLTVRDKIIKLKSLQKLGKNKELMTFISGGEVNDAEFFMARVEQAYAAGSYKYVESNIEKALSAPRIFVEYDEINKKALYYNAKVSSARFYASPGKDSYMEALENWRNFAALFGSDRNSARYNEYREEVRKLGEKYNAYSTNR